MMADSANDLSIRSQHGMLRDLVPIYSVYQLIPNLIVAGLVVWLFSSGGHFLKLLLPMIMLGWVFQFVSRPSVMNVSVEQGVALETVLQEQGAHERSHADGRWRLLDQHWWQRLPHIFIEIRPAIAGVAAVIAPRDIMETLRAHLEQLNDNGVEEEAAPLPWHARVPSVAIGGACVAAWIWHFVTHDGEAAMLDWGLSAAALAAGRFDTLILHMFAHGSAMHLSMNMMMLWGIGAGLTVRLGSVPGSWLRLILLFLASGLAGAALYLALHPAGAVPMVGASGALYGLLGLSIRAPEVGADVMSIRSRRIRRVGWDLLKQNAFLFALLWAMAWVSGTAGGLAWEAHLGGFLFGLLVGSILLPRRATLVYHGEASPESV